MRHIVRESTFNSLFSVVSVLSVVSVFPLYSPTEAKTSSEPFQPGLRCSAMTVV
jgi:hypothetical protein